jgi:hypothetical protein
MVGRQYLSNIYERSNMLKKKAAASRPHSKGFAVNNTLLSILHRRVKSLLINIRIRDNAAETAALPYFSRTRSLEESLDSQFAFGCHGVGYLLHP